MKENTYIINCPKFPSKVDFENFKVWCEWYSPDETDYLKGICSTEQEFEEKIIKPSREGKENYYPLLFETKLPYREFTYILVEIVLPTHSNLKGYASAVEEEIVSITIWLEEKEDVSVYREDRLVAEEENIKAVAVLSEVLNIPKFNQIRYKSDFLFSTKKPIMGKMNLGNI